MKERNLVVGLGELLWDLLPQGAQLGGASANFAVMASRLGSHGVILSRLGHDKFAQDAITGLKQFPVDINHLQVDNNYATGTVSVTLENNQPSYIIHQPVAWDFMETSTDWLSVAERAAVICYGTLAQRNDCSHRTIQSVLAASFTDCIRIFDVNLRQSFYSAQILIESLEPATIVKLNDAEVPIVLQLLGLPLHSHGDMLLAAAHSLLAAFPLQMVAITRGAHGSLLVTRTEHHSHPGIEIVPADTVGAGDAFTAALAHYLLQGASLATLNEAANRWGACVASHTGAMPAIDAKVFQEIAFHVESVAAKHECRWNL